MYNLKNFNFFKNLTITKKSTGGRNHKGKITLRFRGNGHKRRYRLINFQISFINQSGVICTIEYDPNRSSFISLVLYKNGILSYILTPHNTKVGDEIFSGNVSFSFGSSMPLNQIPTGSLIYNVERYPNKGALFSRSAGSYSLLLNKYVYDNQNVLIRLMSSEEYLINGNCWANFGIVSNINYYQKDLVKAGQSRKLGRRPHVRGVAMNPVDHPHGGGEGKTSGGRPSVTPKGKITKGLPTRKKKKYNSFIFRRRNKKKLKNLQINN